MTSAELKSPPAHSTMASLPSAHLSLRLTAVSAKNKGYIPGILKMLSIYPSSLTNHSSKKLVFVSEVSIQISPVISFELADFWRAEVWRVLTTEMSHRHLSAEF